MEQESRPPIAQLDSDRFDMWEAVGGVRGLVESVLPGIVFVVVFVATHDLLWSIVSSVSLAVLAMAARVASKTPITQALSGVGGILIGALWAWRTGEAQDFYVWGLYVNAGFALGTILSILVGHPLVGVFVKGFAPGSGEVPGARRVFRIATLLWAAAFLARLAVQVPLYSASISPLRGGLVRNSACSHGPAPVGVGAVVHLDTGAPSDPCG